MTRIPIRQLVVTYVPSIALLVLASIASIRKQIPIGVLTRDPLAIAGVHPLTGALANVGILLWCSAAAACLLAGAVLHRIQQTRESWFLISSAVLSLFLLFDDFFQFHEDLAQRFLGLNEKLVYVFYLAATAAVLLIFRREILRSEYTFLCFALMFFAMSAGMDALEKYFWRLGDWFYLAEDGAKFLGLASWCSYYGRVSYQYLVRSLGVSPHKDV
jgi:hypothetical protein